MEQTFIEHGELIDFTKFNSDKEIIDILNRIFMNHPVYGKNDPPLYFTEDGQPKEIIYQVLEGNIKVYRHQYSFIETDNGFDDDVMQALYVFSRHLSRAKNRKELPTLYFNMVLLLDKMSLFPCRVNRLSKIMYLKRNKMGSVKDLAMEHNLLNPFFDEREDLLENLDKLVMCECGSVDAERLEYPMLEGGADYMIFPFCIDEENMIGECYYFTKA